MLSVLIVHWNTADLLQRCLGSIFRFHPDLPLEVIVVDNASSDGAAAMVLRDFPQVKLVEAGRNTGYAAGNNLAFSFASGSSLLALNPDTEFLRPTLAEAEAVLHAKPDRGCVAIRLLDPDGTRQSSVRGFPTWKGIIGDITGLGRRFPGSGWDSYRLDGFDYDVSGPAPQPMGTFLLFRREALAAVGDPKHPFDEDFPIFFNDVDLLKRLADKGWQTWYEATLSILHHGGMSTRQVRKSMIWESHRSLIRYAKKHMLGGAGLLVFPFAAGLIWLAALYRARGFDAGFRR
ncbi:MAG: N-acetylglucosaminyl-diphospho-decaprenol L-rhamnosyltransferase [Fimbriimonadaceae bacterium]|nr:N-acetylglucosaminyl-diphospho-decaprenol L-rhamnosyltransferase [Fimbriimonadaceae bacterium]